jgi:hypothetical protein
MQCRAQRALMHVVITTIIITGIPLLLFLRALLELRNPVVESSNQMNVHWQGAIFLLCLSGSGTFFSGRYPDLRRIRQGKLRKARA